MPSLRETLGAKVVVCKPAIPEAKGLIERCHDHLKRSFLPGRSFASPLDFNTELQQWISVVNTRQYRALRCAPTERITADRQAGPDVAADGSEVFAETYTGRILRWDALRGITTVADVGNGPNAARFGPDGFLYFTQNGGQAAQWRSPRQRTPALQRLRPGDDGTATGPAQTVLTCVAGRSLCAPHDLAFGSDGTVYLTDSGAWDPERRPDQGRIIAVDPDGMGRVVAETGATFPSGVAVSVELWTRT